MMPCEVCKTWKPNDCTNNITVRLTPCIYCSAPKPCYQRMIIIKKYIFPPTKAQVCLSFRHLPSQKSLPGGKPNISRSLADPGRPAWSSELVSPSCSAPRKFLERDEGEAEDRNVKFSCFISFHYKNFKLEELLDIFSYLLLLLLLMCLFCIQQAGIAIL